MGWTEPRFRSTRQSIFLSRQHLLRSVPVRLVTLIFFVTYANLQIRGSRYEQDHLQSCEARRWLGLRGKRDVLRAIPNPRGGSQGGQTRCERTGYTGRDDSDFLRG